MKAARIHGFGPPEVIVIDEVPRPAAGSGQVLVRVKGAGVGPWDAWIRENRSVVKLALPVILGSDLAGVVEALGPGVTQFRPGDEVYGVTNPEFVGAYAEYAVASAGMLARKPRSLTFVEAASAPVVAVTAWQMLFDYGKAATGQSVLVQGAGGSVGGYAVQLASQAGLQVYATASAEDAEAVRRLGAVAVVDYRSQRFEDVVPRVDLVLDLVGGETRRRSVEVLRPGGLVVSAVPGPEDPRVVFFLVEVTTARLDAISGLFERGKLAARVGMVLPLAEARGAHERLAAGGVGKTVLAVGG
jgi:NADPH:quinone reductase-like Zn-dependent oxidoreductase